MARSILASTLSHWQQPQDTVLVKTHSNLEEMKGLFQGSKVLTQIHDLVSVQAISDLLGVSVPKSPKKAKLKPGDKIIVAEVYIDKEVRRDGETVMERRTYRAEDESEILSKEVRAQLKVDFWLYKCVPLQDCKIEPAGRPS